MKQKIFSCLLIMSKLICSNAYYLQTIKLGKEELEVNTWDNQRRLQTENTSNTDDQPQIHFVASDSSETTTSTQTEMDTSSSTQSDSQNTERSVSIFSTSNTITGENNNTDRSNAFRNRNKYVSTNLISVTDNVNTVTTINDESGTQNSSSNDTQSDDGVAENISYHNTSESSNTTLYIIIFAVFVSISIITTVLCFKFLQKKKLVTNQEKTVELPVDSDGPTTISKALELSSLEV